MSWTLPFSPDEHGQNDEFKDAAKDEEHTGEHPDVKEGDVGYTGHILSNLK